MPDIIAWIAAALLTAGAALTGIANSERNERLFLLAAALGICGLLIYVLGGQL